MEGIRVILYNKKEDGLQMIHEIFEFNLKDHKRKDGMLTRCVNRQFMEAFEKVIDEDFNIVIEKVKRD